MLKPNSLKLADDRGYQVVAFSLRGIPEALVGYCGPGCIANLSRETKHVRPESFQNGMGVFLVLWFALFVMVLELIS